VKLNCYAAEINKAFGCVELAGFAQILGVDNFSGG
jgi:hypothetical protein